MTDDPQSPEALEGAQLAHRKVLAALVVAVARAHPTEMDRLTQLVDPDAVASSFEEDPGAVPSKAFAIEAALQSELRAIAEEVGRLQGQEPE